MSEAALPPVSHISWDSAVRIIRSVFPPIDLFEDIADPADWPLILSAEQKTNPRLMESVGNLDLVPPERRVAGPGATWLMAPFTHVSPDRPSRFSAGHFGVLYAGRTFETALFETIHHHERFMVRTGEAPGWTSQFREILLDIDTRLHDLRGDEARWKAVLDANDYRAGQELGAALHRVGSDGIVYPSVRHEGGACAGLFYPDCAANPRQSRHIDYHWNGNRVDFYRDAGRHEVFRVI
ncbi:RES family NAD+ phosphorylase [Chelativorans sp. M5D2P16]|uniref:RES family NAD+ phosphorylase n=1 Tax=Chelativorans sp. M5D2P16 TaxID=3095678 RepID=UPI002ACA9966|nr:RES family NAD+ phosphorylase [Chelativorans sp. M5D2P16]MDZ5696037.1 RES family NAD+ phosphorylase [Chelativorans sp. M5D2P16]